MGERGWTPASSAAPRIGLILIALLFCLQTAQATASDSGAHVPSTDDRYTLANGCFALRSQETGQFVVKSAGGYQATAATAGAAEPFRMQAVELGIYLLYGPAQDFMAVSGNTVHVANAPSPAAEIRVTKSSGAFRLANLTASRDVVLGAADKLVGQPLNTGGDLGRFDFVPASGCAVYPEVEVNVDGPQPPTGSPNSPVRGMVETHMHHMAFEFLSTKAHCGRPWHRYGAPAALTDCADHGPNGSTAVLEAALSGTTTHDPGGWPSFAGWPRHNHYTHEQSYYKWVERSWRAGLRVFVNLMVENRVLCELYRIPGGVPTQNCDEMTTVRRELQRTRELENYIDAQNGGPGKGWYRIVESPAEARQVIADGKLAVVLGMEVSEPFGCKLMQPGNVPLCTEAQLDAGIDEMHDLGVRQVELVNKFDNALTGVAGDSGSVGTITNLGNLYSAGTFWDYESCPAGPDDPALNHDHSPTTLSHNDDDLAAGILDLFGDTTGITFPIYGSGPQCNQRGLTGLGQRAVNRLMAKGMVFDPDHMSVLARNSALDLVEGEDYPGVMTSHSWSTDNALPRISGLGGFIGPAAKSPQSFVDQWAHLKTHGYDTRNPYLFGLGYGADMNGFASQGGPPGDQITYPFNSPIDPRVTVNKQVSGQRTFDINADGTAHYGLYPDWTEAVRVAGGEEIVTDLANGAEAYLQMWERARGESAGGGGTSTGAGQAPATGAAADPCAELRAKLKRAKKQGKPKKVQRKIRRQLRQAGCKTKKKKKGKRR